MTPAADTRPLLLLVDDEPINLQVLRHILQEDYRLLFAKEGPRALEMAERERPDLILLDVMMPKLNGFDVLDILRNTPATHNIHIIMLTALSQPKDAERAKELGADDFLVKSQVVISDVVDRIKHQLSIKD